MSLKSFNWNKWLVPIGGVMICALLPLILVSLVMFTPLNTGTEVEMAAETALESQSSLLRGNSGAEAVIAGGTGAGAGALGATSSSAIPAVPQSQVTASASVSAVLAATPAAQKKGDSSASSISDSKKLSNKLDAKHHRELAHLWSAKPTNAMDLHFIHIPKCGGTSMTTILRQVACEVDSDRNEDCCTNPGFCDFHAHRRCSSIKGCINHFPQTEWINKAPPSITIMREPMSRLLSAWFYRGHSPNLDFFQVRPEFKEIKLGKRPRATFDEYLDMPEYNNIQTRMLGANSFPYKNITVTQALFDTAVDALDNMYFVGIQEVYDLSVKVMLRELNFKGTLEVVKERDQASNKKMKREKESIRNNATLVSKIRDVNEWDRKLYLVAVKKFCDTARKYSDLYALVQRSGKVRCE